MYRPKKNFFLGGTQHPLLQAVLIYQLAVTRSQQARMQNVSLGLFAATGEPIFTGRVCISSLPFLPYTVCAMRLSKKYQKIRAVVLAFRAM